MERCALTQYKPWFHRSAKGIAMKSMNTKNRASGFSILELMVAMSLGLIILGAATQLFNVGMKTSALVSNRIETQQNARTALNLIAQDVSLAGAGLPPGGLQLPVGGPSLSRFGCDQGPICYLNNNTYPVGTVGTVAPTTPVSNYMFGLIPGSNNGIGKPGLTNIPATNRIPDAVTSIYVDNINAFNLFTGAFPNPATNAGKTVTLTAPTPMPATLLPATDPGVGIKVGDLLLITTSLGSAVGEVSTVAPLNTTGATVTFADGDPLAINQSTATASNINAIVTGAGTPVKVQRLLVITYYIQVPTGGQLPRLMRQVNGQTPQPVADNIIDLQFDYDMCDTGNTGGTCANTADPLAVNISPNNIHKITIKLMAESLTSNGKDSQSMQLSTAVSARNLTFRDRYQ